MADLVAPETTKTAELSTDLRQLVQRSEEIRAKSRAANTERAYKSAWGAFVAWCSAEGCACLPADPRAVALYLTHLEREGLAFSTIALARAAIIAAHRRASEPFDADHAHLSETMEGLARTLGVAAQHEKAALDEKVLRQVIGALGSRTIDVRDRALLLLGVCGALRRSELAALTCRDLTFCEEGARLMVRRNKADQHGEGHERPIFYSSDPTMCPVRAVRAWLEVAGIAEGALFRPVDRHGRIGSQAITPAGVAIAVKRTCRAAGLDASAFSGHSLRAGFVTTAAAHHKELDAIMRQTGHKSVATVRKYIRHVQLFEHSAAMGLF